MWDGFTNLIASFGFSNWITTGLAVAIAIFAARQTYRLREDKSIRYYIAGKQLFAPVDLPLDTKISLRVGNKGVEVAYYFAILIENCGTRAIEPSDIAEELIVISTATQSESAKNAIKLIELSSADDQPNCVRIDQGEGNGAIQFDHISPNGGMLVHGISSVPPRQLNIQAKLKSFGSAKKKNMSFPEALAFPIMPMTIIVPLAILVIYLKQIIHYIIEIEFINKYYYPLFLLLIMTLILLIVKAGDYLIALYDRDMVRRAGPSRSLFLKMILDRKVLTY